MRIALIRRLGKPYDPVKTKTRYWLRHLKAEFVTEEMSVYYYLKHHFPHLIVDLYSKNTLHKLDHTKYKYVFPLWFDLTMIFTKQGDAAFEKAKQTFLKIPNMIPNVKYIKFILDKCMYTKFLQKHSFDVLPTKCVSVRSLYRSNLKVNHFVKPVPSAESTNATLLQTNENVKTYFDKVKQKKYNKVLIQPFIKTFATKKSPEVRTLWCGNKYMYSIHTEAQGWPHHIRKTKLPKKVNDESVRLITLLQKTFGIIPTTRIDWGKDGNKWFINEIEYAGSSFSELASKHKFMYDKCVAKYIAAIVSS